MVHPLPISHFIFNFREEQFMRKQRYVPLDKWLADEQKKPDPKKHYNEFLAAEEAQQKNEKLATNSGKIPASAES